MKQIASKEPHGWGTWALEKTVEQKMIQWSKNNHFIACKTLDRKAEPVPLGQRGNEVSNNRNICTFQNAAQSLLKFRQMSQARQSPAQRPHRE